MTASRILTLPTGNSKSESLWHLPPREARALILSFNLNVRLPIGYMLLQKQPNHGSRLDFSTARGINPVQLVRVMKKYKPDKPDKAHRATGLYAMAVFAGRRLAFSDRFVSLISTQEEPRRGAMVPDLTIWNSRESRFL